MSYPVPNLETERLLLRAITTSDIPAYEKYFIDYEVIRHLSTSVPWPYPQDGVRNYLHEQMLPHQGSTRWDWGLFRKSKPDELIGSISLWKRGAPEQRGFWLGKEFWGNGYMSEAARAVERFAFLELRFPSIILSNAQGNLRSRRIKEKSGASFVKTIQVSYVGQEYSHAEIWELTVDAWLNSLA